MDTVGIIGAGPAGLAAAAELKRAGIPFEVLERHSDAGGIWDLENPGTPMYESAHFISSKTLSGFEGFPFPDHFPDYPRRDQVLDYLRDYAERSGAAEHISFGTEVTGAERMDEGWTVRTADGSERSYGHLVAANGHQWTPRLPDYPGTFAGETLHSRDYRTPDIFRGKRVLIVGAGNSGCDIACDAATNAAATAISVRRGYHFIPKYVFGQPADVFAHGGPRLPLRAEQAMLTLVLRISVGDITRYGLPAPDHRVLESHPIMNTQVLHYMGHGDVTARGDIAELRGEEVAFESGETEPFDLIVWATGYEVDLPYLDRGLFDWRGSRPQLFLTQFHPTEDDLSVMGLFEVDGGAYPVLSLQGRLLAAVLTAQATRPQQARAFRALKQTQPDLSGGTRHVDSERHDISIQDAAYQRYARGLLSRLESGSTQLSPPARRRLLARA